MCIMTKLFNVMILITIFWLSAVVVNAQFSTTSTNRIRRWADASAPTCNTARKGYIYYSTDTDTNKYCNGSSWTVVSSGSSVGTVTNTGGALTANSVVLGAGSADTKVIAGITTDGTSKVTLGVAGSNVGAIDFKNATSGTITLSPVTGALGTVTLSLPAAADTLVGKATTDSLTNKVLTTQAGTTGVAPINITAGTNLTTPAAGAIEYDGKVFMGDTAASQRALLTSTQFVSNTSDTTLTNGTSAQSIFAAANDVLTVTATTSYFFEAEYFLTTGATTHTTATLFGGTATFTSVNYWAELWSVTDGTISTTAPSVLRVAVATSTVLNATSTATGTIIRLKGIIRVNGAGTLIPQIAFSADPTGTLLGKANSYFKIVPIGTNTVTNIGPWN